MAAGAADKPHDRADVDDRSTAGLGHLLGREPGAEKDARLVDRDDPVPTVETIRSVRTAGRSSARRSAFCSNDARRSHKRYVIEILHSENPLQAA